jgi:hypothetical protein
MVRRSLFIIGLGLALLWWIGLSLNHSAGLLWFDAVGAVLAFGIAGLVDDTVESKPSYAFGPALLGLGLGLVWIAGMTSGQPVWAAWLNFLFAIACLTVAVMAAGAGRRYQLAHRRA